MYWTPLNFLLAYPHQVHWSSHFFEYEVAGPQRVDLVVNTNSKNKARLPSHHDILIQPLDPHFYSHILAPYLHARPSSSRAGTQELDKTLVSSSRPNHTLMCFCFCFAFSSFLCSLFLSFSTSAFMIHRLRLTYTILLTA